MTFYITVHLYFEVMGAKLYGGENSVGYCQTKFPHYFELEEIYTPTNISNLIYNHQIALSNFLNVPIKDIHPISRKEYLSKTEDDEEGEEFDETGNSREA
jgi:hypothetical protein